MTYIDWALLAIFSLHLKHIIGYIRVIQILFFLMNGEFVSIMHFTVHCQLAEKMTTD